jgi:hypothetical protein
MQREELLPVASLIVSPLIGAIGVAVLVTCFPGSFLLLLIAIALTAFIAIRLAEWPLIEYSLLILISSVLACLVWNFSVYGLVIPGAVMGYLIGGWAADLLDRPNVARLTKEAQSCAATRNESKNSG